MSVNFIENAEKNPKEILSWINVADVHKSKPPATVNYTKHMPDFDLLMEEWPMGMEKALRDVAFPTPDIEMNTLDYASVMLALLGIPRHKNPNNKAVIEGLHVMLTLYSDFKENQHIK
jgi:intraflagellar transport protein 46